MSALALYFSLKSKKSTDEILNFCKETGRCKGHRSLVGKFLLKSAGYKTKEKMKYLDIFNELTTLGIASMRRTGNLSLNIGESIQLNPNLKELIAKHASKDLLKFMKINGYDVAVEYPGSIQTPFKEISTRITESI